MNQPDSVLGDVRELSSDQIRTELIKRSRLLLGKPYDRMAAPSSSPHSFSCSSFVKVLYSTIGIWLPRYSVDQSYMGREIDLSAEELLPGDLLFFRNRFPIHDPDRSIGHVAIASKPGYMIHGSSPQSEIFEELIPDSLINAKRLVPNGTSLILDLKATPINFQTALDLVRFCQRVPLST